MADQENAAITSDRTSTSLLADYSCHDDFQGITREQSLRKRRLDLKEKRLNLLERMMDAIEAPNLSTEAVSLLINISEILKSSNNLAEVKEPELEPEPEHTNADEPGLSSSNNPYIPRLTDPCVQKYNADLELVEVYETIREAARQNLNAKTFDISSAISNNTIYLGCRWAMVARENKDVSQTLQPTQTSNKRVRDRVAKIDPATGKIVRVFPDGVAAAISLAMGKTAVTTAIAKNNGHLEGFVWKFWSTCSAEEQASYEGDIADVAIVTSAKRVRQLDPNTGAVVKTWTNMQELVQAFKTCHKTINKKSAEASVYKGFRWQVTD